MTTPQRVAALAILGFATMAATVLFGADTWDAPSMLLGAVFWRLINGPPAVPWELSVTRRESS